MAPRHIMTLLAPAWGHSLPYIQLAVRMLSADSELVITIVQHNLLVPMMEKELASCTYDRDRLKIVGVGVKGVPMSPAFLKEATEQLVGGWLETLGKVLGESAAPWPQPRTLHMDFFGGCFAFPPTKAMLGPDGKILMWCSAGVTSIADHFGGNLGDLSRAIFADETRRAGRSMEDVMGDVIESSNGSDKLDGRTISIAGILDIYDHEHTAFGAGGPRQLAPVLVSAQDMAQAVDGFFCAGSSPLEPAGAEHSRSYFAKRNQELFLLGPQMSEKDWAAPSVGPGPDNTTIKSFLDSAVQKYGASSVLYISFGSFFFPVATPHLVEAMIDVLLDLETPIPFVFVLAGPMASLPKATIDRIHDSGQGLVCDSWVDQKAILQSGSIGWFLTHGGYNSLTESLSQGIPLIFWPIGAEQAVNAAVFSQEPHAIGIELFQIRAGKQLGPSLRPEAPKITGTVEDAKIEFAQTFAALKGSKGKGLREAAAKIGRLWREERVDGESARELIRFIQY